MEQEPQPGASKETGPDSSASRRRTKWIAAATSLLSASVGALIGVATDNVGLGIFGVLVGLLVGGLIMVGGGRRRRRAADHGHGASTVRGTVLGGYGTDGGFGGHVGGGDVGGAGGPGMGGGDAGGGGGP